MKKDKFSKNKISFKNAFVIGLLMGKIEYWQNKYEFSFQFWGEENNTVYINRGSVEIASFGGEKTIQKILERAIAWCEKANPRFKYPKDLINNEIDLPE